MNVKSTSLTGRHRKPADLRRTVMCKMYLTTNEKRTIARAIRKAGLRGVGFSDGARSMLLATCRKVTKNIEVAR